ncbi:nucleotidyltransferase family protein [Rhizobium sp. 16-488-2a]|nr:nucleotidyltransferase family protein [Rhizobium sp. 16-488-2b]MBO9178228.1 nucleotidyltransferase family protein [Rhizobium sp. 16-488-2a]
MQSGVAIVVLAAGRSTRMGNFNKLFSKFGGVPLVRLSTTQGIATRQGSVIVVTGHMAAEVRNALTGLPVEFAHNSDYASGLSSSIRAALHAVPENCRGMLIHLADMPLVTEGHLTSLMDAFASSGGVAVVRATAFGAPGNPVVLPRSLFPALLTLDGDRGARHIISASGIPVIDVEIGRAASVDVDTPEALEAAGGSYDRGGHSHE